MSKEQVAFVSVSNLLSHLYEFGYNRQQLLAKAGVSEAALNSYEVSGQLPASVFSSLYYSAVGLIPDQIRQSFWAGGFEGKTFRLTAYTMITAHTFRQALQRVHDFHQLIDNRHPHISIATNTGLLRLTYTPAHLAGLEYFVSQEGDTDRIVGLAITSGLTAWHSFLSWMIGQRIELERVVFGDAVEQADGHQGIMQLLKYSDIEYLPGDSFIEFSARYLDSPIVVTPELLDRYLDYAPHEPMSTVADSNSMIEQIQALIGRDLSQGLPGFDQLADRLGVSVSSLRRKLLAENTSYQAIKDEVRKKLAIEQLCNSNISIKGIAEKTGFMSQGSFSRFFREWTGMSPQQYREKHQQTSSH